MEMLSYLELDPMTCIILVFFVTGIVELIKNIFDRKWRKVAIILGSGIAGLVASPFLGLSWLIGWCSGIGASGCITITQNIGKGRK